MRCAITYREYAALQLVIQGKTNREIAKQLYIDKRTADDFVYRILKKANIQNRCKLTVAVIRGEIEFYPHKKDNIKALSRRMKVEKLFAQGLKIKEIAHQVKLSHQSVWYILKCGVN